MYKKTLLLFSFIGLGLSWNSFADANMSSPPLYNEHLQTHTVKGTQKKVNYFLYLNTASVRGVQIQQAYQVTAISKTLSNFIGFKLKPITEQENANNFTSKRCLNISHSLDFDIKDEVKKNLLLIVKDTFLANEDWNIPPVPLIPVPFYTLPKTTGEIKTEYVVITNDTLPKNNDPEGIESTSSIQFNQWMNLRSDSSKNNNSLLKNWIPHLFIPCNHDYYNYIL